MYQQLKLVSELESDLQDTVGWGRKLFIDFGAKKTQFISFDHLSNSGANNVKIMGQDLSENHLSRCWVSLFLLNWIRTLTLLLLLKLPLRKSGL